MKATMNMVVVINMVIFMMMTKMMLPLRGNKGTKSVISDYTHIRRFRNIIKDKLTLVPVKKG